MHWIYRLVRKWRFKNFEDRTGLNMNLNSGFLVANLQRDLHEWSGQRSSRQRQVRAA